MTASQQRNRDPKPTYRLSTEWVAYLRLRGIVEVNARVTRCLLIRFIRPDCAIALFQMGHRSGGGWFTVAAFQGERHWKTEISTEEGGRAEYRDRLSHVLKLVDPDGMSYDPVIHEPTSGGSDGNGYRSEH